MSYAHNTTAEREQNGVLVVMPLMAMAIQQNGFLGVLVVMPLMPMAIQQNGFLGGDGTDAYGC